MNSPAGSLSRYCLVAWLLAPIDLAFALSAPLLALCLRNLFDAAPTHEGTFAVYALSSSAVSLILLWSTGCSRATWKYFSWGDAFRAAQVIALGVAIGGLCGFAHDRLLGVARAVPFVQFLIQAVAFVGIRLIARKLGGLGNSSPKGKAKQVLVVGCDKAALTYMSAVRELSNGSIEVAGLVSETRSMVGQTIRGKRVLGTISDVGEVVATLQVHGVEIWRLAVAARQQSLPYADVQAIEQAARKFELARVDVDAVLSEFSSVDVEPEAVAASEAVVWKPFYAFTKRAIDLCGSTLLLVALAPLMLVLCAVVAVDVGFPILFWQQRLGKDGKRLTVYKFRTMLAPLDSAGRRIPDTRRMSVVGHWMRKLRLDELPQLISILKGDMSFVGPRPLLPIDQPSDAGRRLSVKPGLTGWAQVHGGNLVAIEDKNALDLWYVAHSSLRLDIEIALRTVRMVLQGDSLDSNKIAQAKDWQRGFDFA